MGFTAKVRGDFREADPQVIEGFLRQVIAQITGEKPQRVVFHGVHRQRLDDLINSAQFKPDQ